MASEIRESELPTARIDPDFVQFADYKYLNNIAIEPIKVEQKRHPHQGSIGGKLMKLNGISGCSRAGAQA